MYEREVEHRRARTLPALEVHAHDSTRSVAGVQALAVLPWEEHCTECAEPACYETCPLYEARSDGRCRRFDGGFVEVRGATPALQGEMVSVSFKRWGQLEARGNARLVRLDRVRLLERALRPAEALARWSPDSRIAVRGRRGLTARIVRRLKQHIASGSPLPAADDAPPDYFLAEIHNPNEFPVRLSLTIRGEENGARPPFQTVLDVTPGFRRYDIDAAEIAARIDLSRDFTITLTPNITEPQDEGLELLFGTLSFVRDPTYRRPKRPARHVKVIAWDLDNTVWRGTLIEDGPGKVTLMPGVAGVIRELDRRGIVNTLVSKNNEQDALSELERLGLSEYMVMPQVSWRPKSVSVKELIRRFNVGEDAFAFIDDSPFERAEVQTSLPRVRTYDGDDYRRLLTLPEFSPPQSSESSRRREFYLSEDARERARAEFDGEYDEFLRGAHIKLAVARARDTQLDRIAELAQRTNQLNFSGTRYATETLAAMLTDERLDCFVMSCADDFGDYGTVGFAVVEKDGPKLVDLMFSCRIQSKRVEHAFLEFLLSWEARQGRDELLARYVRTERNSPAGEVFDDMAFEQCASDGDAQTLRRRVADAELGHQPPSVSWEGQAWTW
jgi:FkbH-like protein